MLRPLCKRLVGCYKLSSSSCRFLFSFMFFTTFVLLWQTETLGWEITFQYGRAEIFKRGLSSIVVVMLWPGSKISEYRVLCTIIALYDCKYHTLREKCLYLEFFLVRIFLYLDWVRRDTLSVYSPNAGKCRPEKLQIQILFKQWHFQRNNCWRRKTKRDILVIWFELPVQKLLPSHNWKVNTKINY